MTTRKSRTALALFSVALIVAAGVAEARGGRGGGFGSRGMRTFEPPAVTRTAPRPAQPIERSTTQQGAQQPGARTPGVGQTAPRSGGFFNRPGFMGGLFGGLLGAGLIGMLFGSGFLGGLSGLGSFLGLALQIALVFFLVRWAMRAFARRSQPAMAGGPPLQRSGLDHNAAPLRRVDAPAAPRSGTSSRAGRPLGSGPGTSRTSDPDELGVTQQDLDEFERILGEVQDAYSREDATALRRITTPEMLSYFLEELTDNASRGVVNRVSDVKLLSGDVAESWREGDTEYATAAMRFGLTDEVLERDSGRVVETGPSEATELWTFRRARGGQWLLSAIQQG
jgi:predicted lipid-binding transport protein (Tim44 family)